MSELVLVDREKIVEELKDLDEMALGIATLTTGDVRSIINDHTHTPTWIPVSERLPEENQSVHVLGEYWHDSYDHKSTYRPMEAEFYSDTFWVGDEGKAINVTHWAERFVQEPPELPEAEDE